MHRHHDQFAGAVTQRHVLTMNQSSKKMSIYDTKPIRREVEFEAPHGTLVSMNQHSSGSDRKGKMHAIKGARDSSGMVVNTTAPKHLEEATHKAIVEALMGAATPQLVLAGESDGESYVGLPCPKASEIIIDPEARANYRRNMSRNGGLASVRNGSGLRGLSTADHQANSRQGGLASVRNGSGLHGLSTADRQANGRQGGLLGGAASKRNGSGIFGRSTADHQADSRQGGLLGGAASKRNGSGFFGRSTADHQADSMTGRSVRKNEDRFQLKIPGMSYIKHANRCKVRVLLMTCWSFDTCSCV
jgi:hypothetical protein